MPKEVTHFLIAEKVCEELDKSPFWKPYLKNKNLILLGSIFQDSLYYLPDDYSEEIVKLPDVFHGANGEDTFLLIKELLMKNVINLEDSHIISFIIGMITHICADSTVHPVVYYYTGNYYDKDPEKKSKAVTYHRKIEGLFDVYFCEGYQLINQYSIQKLLDTGVNNRDFFGKISKGITINEESEHVAEAILKAYERFGNVQKYFNHPLIRNILPFADKLVSKKYRELFGLFYSSDLKKHLHNVSGPINYQNPLTGEEYDSTLNELFSTSVKESIKICKLLEDILTQRSSVEEIPYGPSLELGQPHCYVDNMQYFYKKDFFKKEGR
ncbi:zinc dependent phospholipase C family protein [Niallia sp. Krafla_26]|uniref:zinc dependent phospholipase C family protein n=1 Tax=Niallia sp. Krafla_26 TaxID=3064703 RepID=UPI003D16AC47